MYHHYVVKAAIILVLVIGLNIFFKVSFMVPVSWVRRMPMWLRSVVDFIEMYGWIVIVALVIAAIWQIAERR